MDWETATDASMTPRATTPQASTGDDNPSDSLELDNITSPMQSLLHEHEKSSAIDLAAASVASTSGMAEEQFVTRSHRQRRNNGTHFERLEWQLERLLADLEAGRTLKNSQIESYESWLATFEPIEDV